MLEKIKTTLTTIYTKTDTVFDFVFNFVSHNPKTTLALWAVSVYLTWRLS